MERKIAFITGATSGIGKATAIKLYENNFDLILCGRREDRLRELEKEFINKGRVLCLKLDVRNENEVKSAVEGLSDSWRNIDVLINNAGLAAGKDPIQNGSIDDWERMIDTNVKGLLYVTRHVSALMIKNQSGHIINIGSLAGKEVYENGNVYCATKHAVDALSRGMRIDLLPHSIKVSNIAPGLVETEFSIVRFAGDVQKAKTVYEGYDALNANDIAECIWFVVSRPKHVCVGDMLILPSAQANSTNVLKKIN